MLPGHDSQQCNTYICEKTLVAKSLASA